MQLELTAVPAYLANVNARAEMHGEEKQPAGDLKIKVQLGNDVLAMFHPTLKSMLYYFDKAKAEDDDLAEQAKQGEAGYAPHIRFQQLPGISWEDEMVGAKVTIHAGIDQKSDIVLDPCDVNNFKLEPQEGGTVQITFRVQAHPDEKQFGKLSFLIGTNTNITIDPPRSEPSE